MGAIPRNAFWLRSGFSRLHFHCSGHFVLFFYSQASILCIGLNESASVMNVFSTCLNRNFVSNFIFKTLLICVN